MLKTLDVPHSNLTDLKKSPTDLFNKAKEAKSGVYIFNRNTPAGVVMSVDDYENMVKKVNELKDELLDAQVEAQAVKRLATSTITHSDAEVRGEAKANEKTAILDDDDGWE